MYFLAIKTEDQFITTVGGVASGDLHMQRMTVPVEMQQGRFPGNLYHIYPCRCAVIHFTEIVWT